MHNQQKTAAIMQPYIFPYIGYFQLIYAVDIFVFYDDVNFIKQGWINRNKILNKNKPLFFTIPLDKPSSFKSIIETKINHQLYEKWRYKFLKTLEQTYKKAPNFNIIYPLVQEILNFDKETNIANLAMDSNIKIAQYLGISTKFCAASEVFSESKIFQREERLIHICESLKVRKYINVLSGKELYSKEEFKMAGVDLYFLNTKLKNYKQFDNEFVPGLSMIDVLMFNTIAEIHILLKNFELE